MTNVYGSAKKNIPPILLLLCHLIIDRANSRSFPMSSQLSKSEFPTFSQRVRHSKIPTFPPPQGQKFCCKVSIKSPYSPTSAWGPQADDKCITLEIFQDTNLKWIRPPFCGIICPENAIPYQKHIKGTLPD